MLLVWFWRSRSERKADPEVGFCFPGGLLRDGRCFVELVLVSPARWPQRCLGLSRGDTGLRMATGGSGAVGMGSSFGRSPLFFPLHLLSVLIIGDGTRSLGKGEAAPLVGDPPANPAG